MMTIIKSWMMGTWEFISMFFRVDIFVSFIFKKIPALTDVAQLVGHHPTKQKVASLTSSQGTCMDCQFNP